MAQKPNESAFSKIQEQLLRNQGADALEALAKLPAEVLDRPEVLTLRAVALSQVGRSEEATATFVRATELEPESAKYHFNLASQYESTDQLDLAKASVKRAVELHPSHIEARAMLQRLGETVPELVAPPRPTMFSVMLGREPSGGPARLLNLGEKWTWFGYGLATLLLIACVLWHVYHPLTLVATKDAKAPMTIGLSKNAITPITIVLYVGSTLLSSLWLTVDVIDRRRRFVWLLPMFVCGFCALPIIPLALYLKLGRNSA